MGLSKKLAVLGVALLAVLVVWVGAESAESAESTESTEKPASEDEEKELYERLVQGYTAADCPPELKVTYRRGGMFTWKDERWMDKPNDNCRTRCGWRGFVDEDYEPRYQYYKKKHWFRAESQEVKYSVECCCRGNKIRATVEAEMKQSAAT